MPGPTTAVDTLPRDSLGSYFTGPWDSATGTGLAQRAANSDGTYGDSRVVLFDASGNALLTAVDMDTGGGTAYRAGVAVLVAANGGPVPVPGDATNGLKVQVAAALPAGTAAIGKLAANSGVDIGDVDVTSLPYTAAITDAYSAVTAGTSSSAIIGSNGSRKYGLVQNVGAVDVWVRIGVAAVVGQGILLTANGGSYEFGLAFGNLRTGAVNMITAAGSSSVVGVEG